MNEVVVVAHDVLLFCDLDGVFRERHSHYGAKRPLPAIEDIEAYVEAIEASTASGEQRG